jgi:bifunctional oligoribonuclease and PAP phosphatase NrnA
MKVQHSKLIWQDTEYVKKLMHESGKNIALLMHINPDGDALGSALGLCKLLENMGHHGLVISQNDFPEFLKWMPGINNICFIKNSFSRAEEFLKQADLIFVVDFNEMKRIIKLKDAYNSSRAYKVMIDHHPDPELDVDCILSDTSVSSTAELIYRFMVETGLQEYADRDFATCVLTGIMTDTGCFSHNSSTRGTYDTVAALLDFDIDKDEIYYRIYNNYSRERMQLLGLSLHEKMEVIPDLRTAIITLTRKDLTSFNYQDGDTEGFVNFPLSIKGIRFSVLFQENVDQIKISFRSKGNFAVNEFSRKHFGGGGHLNASGGQSFASMEETVSLFKSLIPAYRNELSDYEE